MQAKKRPAIALVWTVFCSAALLASCATSNDAPGNPGTAGNGTAGTSAAGTTGAAGTTSGSGGTANAGGAAAGQTGRGGDTGTGGSASGTAGTGGYAGSSTAGTTGSGGTTGAGGTSGAAGTSAGGGRGGGTAGSGAGTGGTSSGGSSGGGTTGKAPPVPSAGCSKANPSTGSSGSPLMVSGHQYYVKLPSGYDANKPYPVIIMFNPTGNPITWAEQNAGFEKNGAKDAAIRVYPHPANQSNGWVASDVSFFMPLYTQITGAYCIDKARVFAAGESSGGDFSSILGCEYGDVVRGVAPAATKDVSQYPLDTSRRQCKGEVTAIVIHGKNDNVVGPANGPKTRDFYTKLNHCGTTTQPVQGYTDTLSNCLLYQGCDEGFPVYWCNHTDPEYSGTNHGWPKFAANMVWSTFSAY
jgi:polyhydroxybutyrate depolymerase